MKPKAKLMLGKLNFLLDKVRQAYKKLKPISQKQKQKFIKKRKLYKAYMTILSKAEKLIFVYNFLYNKRLPGGYMLYGPVPLRAPPDRSALRAGRSGGARATYGRRTNHKKTRCTQTHLKNSKTHADKSF